MGQEEVGNPQSADGSMAAGEEVGCGRMRCERASPMPVGRGKEVQCVLVVEVAEDHLCLMQEVGVADLHVMELLGGSHAVTGLGEEAGGQSGLEEVEGLEQTDRSPAKEGEALVCRVEVVEVQKLRCNNNIC